MNNEKTIDHVNQNKVDNRLSNLRDVCQIEQGNNTSMNNDLSRGVVLRSRSGKYEAIPWTV